MKRLIILFIPVMLALVSCSKGVNNEVIPVNATTANTQGALTVKCENCKIDYGMPDQYHGYNIAGTSPALSFNYKSGYTLQANVYALDHDQAITYVVYDTKGRIIYQNMVTQSTEGFWQVNVLLP